MKQSIAILVKKILIIPIILLYSCHKTNNSQIIFPQNKEIVEIEFKYSSMGNMVTKCVIRGDTMNFIVDTGASISLLFYNSQHPQNGDSVTVKDINHTHKTFPLICIDTIQWGDLLVNNYLFGEYSIPSKDIFFKQDNVEGIIGGDILKNFRIKINNETNTLILTQKAIPDSCIGIKVPLHIEPNNTVSFYMKIQGQKYPFIFDTGYAEDISIDSTIFKSFKATRKMDSTHWYAHNFSLFPYPDLIKGESTYIPDSVTLGNRIFSNAILSYSHTNNMIGLGFLNRFRSITIDYLDSIAYFTLPLDYGIMEFSKNPIQEAPVSYLNLLYDWVNSLGINTKRTPPFTVTALKKRFVNAGIERGDTLIGMDNVIFEKQALSQLLFNKRKYHLELDQDKQKELINNTYYKKNKVVFHFIKKGKLISLHDERDCILTPSPTMGYSINYKNHNMGYYINATLGSKNFTLHFPWSNLSGKAIKLSFFENGKETKLSNDPEQENPKNSYEN